MKDMCEFRDATKNVTYYDYNCEIGRQDFEKIFSKTAERVRFTFQGWDGKSYDGESRNAFLYSCNLPGWEDERFIKVGKGIHRVMFDTLVLEKATGETHPTVTWIVNVSRM